MVKSSASGGQILQPARPNRLFIYLYTEYVNLQYDCRKWFNDWNIEQNNFGNQKWAKNFQTNLRMARGKMEALLQECRSTHSIPKNSGWGEGGILQEGG